MENRSRFTVALLALLSLLLVPEGRSEEPGALFAAAGAAQRQAEEVFAVAEAAIYFQESGDLRWLASGRAAAAAHPVAIDGATLRDFDAALERDYPGFETNAWGPYLLKRPSKMAPVSGEATPVEPAAAVFTESFENGMGEWSLENNTLDLYSWGPSTCDARTGSRSADAVRGGVNTLSCTDPYGASLTTTMTHRNCEGISGASQAWLDVFVKMSTEINADGVGFYYRDPTGDGWGYAFSGTFPEWFHLVFNLKQWYRVGDVTAASCPQLVVQFRSDESIQSGYGVRLDDLTIGNAAPSFLTAAINATPTSGAVPLAVNFGAVVSGASSAATYQWLFGDAGESTASTASTSFTYTTAGDYYPRLRVEDGAARAYARILVRATSGASCSVSCSASAPSSALTGTAALFQAAATATGCSGVTSYAWTFGDGQTSSQQNASHAYSAPGTYTWTLTASAAGTSCTKSGTIAVSALAASGRKRFVRRSGDLTLGTATIGPAGGSLTGGGVTLTVPAGAFSLSTTLTLRKAGAPRLEGDLSDTYAVTGLPASLLAGVTVEIDVGSVALGAAEKIYVAIDAAMSLKSKPAAEADVAMMVPIEATLSGSKARATIPASWPMPHGNDPGRSEQSLRPRIYTGEFRVKAETKTTWESAHFAARGRSSEASTSNAILSMMEAHYDKIVALGFSLGCRETAGAFRKIAVELSPLGTGESDPLGYHVSGGDPCGTNWVFTSDYLQITTSIPASDARVRTAAAHELFHLVQDMYSPGGARANLWLKEASSIWIENALGACPDVQIANLEFTWQGLFNAADSASGTEARHGYGASFALKYRTDQSAVQNDPFLATIWQNIRLGNGEVAAFQSALGSSLPAYWKEFAKKFLSGNAGGTCFPAWAHFEREAVASETDLPRSTSFQAYPLSAKSWNVDLIRFKSSAAVSATVTASGLIDNQSIFVHDVKTGSELAELTPASPSYEVADLNALSGTVLVLAFVDTNTPGSFSPTNTVTLKVSGPELETLPWSYQYQWPDTELGSAATWTSSGSGTVKAPKGSTVKVDTVAGSNAPTIRIRAHGAPGALVVSGTFLATVNPTSGRKTNSDGSYADFSFTNPQFLLDDGNVSPGADFRYEIPADRLQRGIIQYYKFDVSIKYYDKDGKQTGTGGRTGQTVLMVIDFERDDD